MLTSIAKYFLDPSHRRWYSFATTVISLSVIIGSGLDLARLGGAITAFFSVVILIEGYEAALKALINELKTATEEQNRRLNQIGLSINRTLEYYTIPGSLRDHPLVGGHLSHSLRLLAESHWQRHNGGEIPVIENFTSRITIDNLSSADFEFGVADVEREIRAKISDVRLRWLKFTIVSSWDLRPQYRAKSEVLDPLSFLGYTVATDWATFEELLSYGLISSENNWYQPLPTKLSAHQILGPIFKTKAKYLMPVLKNDQRNPHIRYRITKWTDREIVGQAVVNLVPKMDPLNPDTEWVRHLLKLDSRHFETDGIETGILQVYEPQYSNPSAIERMKVNLPVEKEKSKWHVDLELDYVLPIKMEIGSELIWRQDQFLYPMARVSKCSEVIISKSASLKALELSRPTIFAVLAGPTVQIIDPFQDHREYIVKPGDVFLFPGDSFIFRWELSE